MGRQGQTEQPPIQVTDNNRGEWLRSRNLQQVQERVSSLQLQVQVRRAETVNAVWPMAGRASSSPSIAQG